MEPQVYYDPEDDKIHTSSILVDIPRHYASIDKIFACYFVSFAVKKKFLENLDFIAWPYPIIVKNSIIDAIRYIQFPNNFVQHPLVYGIFGTTCKSEILTIIDDYLKIPESIQDNELSTVKTISLTDWYDGLINLYPSNTVEVTPIDDLKTVTTDIDTQNSPIVIIEQNNDLPNTNNNVDDDAVNVNDHDEDAVSENDYNDNEDVQDFLTYDLTNSKNVCGDLYRFQKLCTKRLKISKLLGDEAKIVVRFKYNQFCNSFDDYVNDFTTEDFSMDNEPPLENSILLMKVFFVNDYLYNRLQNERNKFNISTRKNFDEQEFDRLLKYIHDKVLIISSRSRKLKKTLKKTADNFYKIFASLVYEEDFSMDETKLDSLMDIIKFNPTLVNENAIINRGSSSRLNQISKLLSIGFGHSVVMNGSKLRKQKLEIVTRVASPKTRGISCHGFEYSLFFDDQPMKTNVYVTITTHFKR